jgi:Mrp family chromosome partitioning ATPase/capsular polysaccharide biosynthesis protein
MNETTDATAIFAPLWRRKWLILAVGIVVAVLSYVYYKQARSTFTASTQIYLGAASEESSPGEKAVKTSGTEVSNQAAIINSIVIEQVHKQLKKHGQASLLRGAKVKAKAAEKGPFIAIAAEAHTSKGTALLANTVADVYVRRRNLTREQSINRSIAISRRQLRRIQAAEAPVVPAASSSKGTTAPAKAPSTSSIIQQANLNTKINQLEASLAVTGAQHLRPATSGVLVSPKPRKDAIFGFVIGIVLASIAAYALSRLDRRLRTLDGIESLFHTQILTALPKVSRPIVDRGGQPSPSRFLLEPLRRLHTTLQLGVPDDAHPDARHRTLLFLSPDAGDGKSTLVADLALVQRDAGERTAIVEANFRSPIQAKLLGLSGEHGLADVLTGTMSIEEAVQRVLPILPVDDGTPTEVQPAGVATAVATQGSTGSLFLLAGSRSVENPPALLGGAAMADVLRSLREDYDYVLIDAPSLLEVSDVMPLLGLVDGVVLVARAGHTRELSAQRFMALLARSPTVPVLGTVANCVTKADISRHGLAPSGHRTWPARLTGS